MKSIINILMMGACFLCSTVFAALDPDSFCLRLDARVLNAGLSGMQSCTVELYCDGKVIKKRVLNRPRQKFRCHLERNRQYQLKLSQTGCFDKVININTIIPGSDLNEYCFSFETKLLEKKDLEGSDREVFLKPVAMVFYDSKKTCFNYDKEYSRQIKKEMFGSYSSAEPGTPSVPLAE